MRATSRWVDLCARERQRPHRPAVPKFDPWRTKREREWRDRIEAINALLSVPSFDGSCEGDTTIRGENVERDLSRIRSLPGDPVPDRRALAFERAELVKRLEKGRRKEWVPPREQAWEIACWVGSRPEETRADLEDWIPGLVALSVQDPVRFVSLYAVWHRCASRLWVPASEDERKVMIARVSVPTRAARSEINEMRNSTTRRETRWASMGGKGSTADSRTEAQQARRDAYNEVVRERMRKMRAKKKEQAALALQEAAE